MDNTTLHKCPNCNGKLIVNPVNQRVDCEFCGATFSVEDLKNLELRNEAQQNVNQNVEQAPSVVEEDILEKPIKEVTAVIDVLKKVQEKAADANSTKTDVISAKDDQTNISEYKCSNCGAILMAHPFEDPGECFYCHHSLEKVGKLEGNLLPDKILPFTVGREDAIQEFSKLAKKKWFLPKEFSNQLRNKIIGVYLPFWEVSGKVCIDMAADGFKERTYFENGDKYEESNFYSVKRKGEVAYKELLKSALQGKVQQKIMTDLQPFPMAETRPFMDEYLTKFQAEKPDIAFFELESEVYNESAKAATTLLDVTTKGYDSIKNKRRNIQPVDTKAELVLLPVWLLAYQTKRKIKHYYALNGRTGKYSCVLPVSYPKVLMTSLGLSFLIMLLGLIGGYFLI